MLRRLLPLAVLTALALPSHAGLFSDDEARQEIADLRQSQATLSGRMDELDKQTGQKLVNVLNQIEQLSDQIAKLRGQLEVMQNDMQNLTQRQKDLYVDLDTRVRALESGAGGGAATQNGTAQPQNPQQEAAAATAYESAYDLYQNQQLKDAIKAFNDIITQYGGTQAAQNSMFWMGMAQAQSGLTKEAEGTLRKLVTSYPQNDKAPEALKVIASLQLARRDRKDAVKTLKEIVANYPNSDAATEAKKQLKRM